MSSSRKTVLITGCGNGGIGHGLALEFESKGYTVMTTVLPFESSDHFQDTSIHVFNCDVTSEEDILTLRDEVLKIGENKLDVLVNCAGICYTMTAIDTDVKEVQKMFNVNVFGPMRMVHHFHRALVNAKGKIVNIGSVGGIVPYVYGSSYNASKAALHHWGNTLRVEMKPFGVHVINIISGEVETNILKRDQARRLPEDSLYKSLEESFVNHVTRNPKRTSREEYASAVVGEVMRSNPQPWFWTGSLTSIVRWGDALFPRTIWDAMFTREFNLNILRR